MSEMVPADHVSEHIAAVDLWIECIMVLEKGAVF